MEFASPEASERLAAAKGFDVRLTKQTSLSPEGVGTGGIMPKQKASSGKTAGKRSSPATKSEFTMQEALHRLATGDRIDGTRPGKRIAPSHAGAPVESRSSESAALPVEAALRAMAAGRVEPKRAGAARKSESKT